ncbi:MULTISPECIES: hypothetical protein [unclassified Fusobacterium]|uniref:hypothetical protein n=1 Tax=unclassified Fusobacterium TaxID=2648384 RepID=UPI001B8C2051|nr:MULTISPECIES: hypothetical protein [unclassified Fusobacterium]MBR8702347.1 hypothetical protein [Fusobacterium sp. DD45]MBR8712165.1 hypothetical protein [Fusobacterium sp. DD28]MBR8752743.1 hypothetical protein [Fusobacterium sp. DD26]
MKKLEEKLSMLLDKPVWVFRRDGYNIQDVGTGNIIQTFDDRAKLDKYKEEEN